jgi:hypothetical protein
VYPAFHEKPDRFFRPRSRVIRPRFSWWVQAARPVKVGVPRVAKVAKVATFVSFLGPSCNEWMAPRHRLSEVSQLAIDRLRVAPKVRRDSVCRRPDRTRVARHGDLQVLKRRSACSGFTPCAPSSKGPSRLPLRRP